MDENKIIPDGKLSIREGAVLPWRNYFNKPDGRNGSWGFEQLQAMAGRFEAAGLTTSIGG